MLVNRRSDEVAEKLYSCPGRRPRCCLSVDERDLCQTMNQVVERLWSEGLVGVSLISQQ